MTEYFPECTTNTLAALGEGMSSRSDELRLAFARKALEIERELPDSGQDAEDDSGFNELVEALWRKAHEITTRDQLCTVDYLSTTESTSLSYAETSECTLRGPTRVHDAAHPFGLKASSSSVQLLGCSHRVVSTQGRGDG